MRGVVFLIISIFLAACVVKCTVAMEGYGGESGDRVGYLSDGDYFQADGKIYQVVHGGHYAQVFPRKQT